MALVNVWHLRRVAETSAKPCDVCYKPTTSVLITPDNKDHFFVCLGHLKDKGFCSPIVDTAEAAAKKKKQEMDSEIELIKKEYEEKLKKKKRNKKDKDSDKEKDRKEDEKEDGKEDDDDAKAEKEKDDKIKAVTNKDAAASSTAVTEEMHRIYALQKVFFQKRLDRIRNAEIARRNRERMKNPSLFPSVPNDLP